MTYILHAVRTSDLEGINQILSGQELAPEIFDCNAAGQNIFDIAIVKNDFLAVSKLIEGLQNKKDKSWHRLLLQKKPLPILGAAKLKDPQIFDLLIKQAVGYSFDELELIKKERELALDSERGLGKIAAFLKSLCPSKSLADTLQIPDTVAGLAFATSAGLLAFITIPAAIVALLGLICISISNYKKLKVEQNINSHNLNKTILWAQLNNFEKRAANPSLSPEEKENLFKELHTLKPLLQEIKKVDFSGKRKPKDFLSAFDKLHSAISTFGEILCSNAGLAGFSALILTASTTALALPLVLAFASIAIVAITAVCFKNTASKNKKFVALAGLAALSLTASLASLGLPILVLTVGCLAFAAISAFYIKNTSQQNKELAEQRRTQFDSEQKLYKSFKNFKYSVIKTFPEELGLLGSVDNCSTTHARPTFRALSAESMDPADKPREVGVWMNCQQTLDIDDKEGILRKQGMKVKLQVELDSLSIDPKDHLRAKVIEGDRRWFKFLMAKNVPLPTKEDDKKHQGKTLLHQAVENEQLILVEEMLGVSIAAKARKNKNRANPYSETTHKKEFERFELLNKTREQIVKHYLSLHTQVQTMCLTKDSEARLPLYYAAQLKDSSLYNLLLKQPVPYEKSDLDAALQERIKRVNKEKWWSLGTALIEAICPGNSLSEIGSSVVLIGLTASATFLGPILGALSLIIYGFVTWSNYHRSTLERGVNTETEKIASDLAYLNSIKLQLEDLKQDPNASENKQMTLKQAIVDIDSLSLIRPPARNNPSAFINNQDRLRVFGSSLGAFLCAYAGVLGLFELATDLTALAIAAGSLSLAGPLGWAFLGFGAVIGLSVAVYFYCNRQHELRLIAENRQTNYFKKEAMAKVMENPNIQKLMKKSTVTASPLAGLNEHKPHPDCDLEKESQILEEKKQELTQEKLSFLPIKSSNLVPSS